VASELPITNGQVWLSSFLTLSMGFIALVCLQCFATGYIQVQKTEKPVPRWVKFLIDISLLRIPYLTEEPLDDEIAEAEKTEFNTKNNLNDQSGDSSGVGASNNDGIALQTLNPLSVQRSDSVNCTPHSVMQPNVDDEEKSTHVESSQGRQHVVHEELLCTRKKKYTWQRGSRAFDRVCRILIPIMFAIFVGVELGTMT
jgi:hypothetical protein